MERYEKTNGIPYTNVKIKGRFLPFVFFLATLIIDIIIYLIISSIINAIVAIAIIAIIAIISLIALIYVADIDKTTKLPVYLMLYYRHIKSYKEIYVNDIAYFIDDKEKEVKRVYFERSKNKFI